MEGVFVLIFAVGIVLALLGGSGGSVGNTLGYIFIGTVAAAIIIPIWRARSKAKDQEEVRRILESMRSESAKNSESITPIDTSTSHSIDEMLYDIEEWDEDIFYYDEASEEYKRRTEHHRIKRPKNRNPH